MTGKKTIANIDNKYVGSKEIHDTHDTLKNILSFPLRISFVNVTKSELPMWSYLLKKILRGKLHFFVHCQRFEITFDTNLTYENHNHKLCNEASQKLNALAGVSNYMAFDKKG